MSAKQYASVSEMLHDIDPKFAREFDEYSAARQIIKRLLILRTAKGLNQLDIVRQTSMVLKEVSEVENGRDADARLGDLQAYAEAVGCQLEVRLVPMPRLDGGETWE